MIGQLEVVLPAPTHQVVLRLRQFEGTPVCGRDFCDECGDCLACNPDDPCYPVGGQEHRWIVRHDDPRHAEFLRLVE